jgi:hypothetical protein
MQFLNLPEPRAAILAAYFIEMGFREKSSSIDHLLEYFEDESGELVIINPHIETLFGGSILIKKYFRRRMRFSIRKELFVHHRVLDAILQQDSSLLRPLADSTFLMFLQEIEELIEMRGTN